MTDAVKPLAQDCPFCGKGARTWEDELGFRGASCSDAECSASELIMTIEQWDRRTPPAGWKPIETAPETDLVRTPMMECLVYGPKLGVKAGRVGKYMGEPIAQAHGYHGEWGITRWMPLPAAPENDDEQI